MQQGSDQYEYNTGDEGESIKLNDIIQKLSDYERVMIMKENKTKINDERMRHKLKETDDELISEKAARMIDLEESTAKVKLLETELSKQEQVMKMKTKEMKSKEEMMRTELKELEDALSVERTARQLEHEDLNTKVKRLETELREQESKMAAKETVAEGKMNELMDVKNELSSQIKARELEHQDLTAEIEKLETKLSIQEKAMKMKTEEMKSKEEMMRAELKKLEDALSVEKTARQLEHEDLNTKVKRLETVLREQETKISSKEENEERMRVKLQMVEDELSSLIKAREVEYKDLTAKITELETKHRTEIKKKDTTIKELDKKNKKQDRKIIDVERKLDGQKTAYLELNEKRMRVQQLNDTLNQELKATRKIVKEQKAEITQKTNHSQQQGVWLQQQDQQIQQYISYSNNLKKDLADSEDKRHDLTLRWSKLEGAQLISNNPNIADLSDTNRPTKIAEWYSALYDEEWTDAYEDLSESSDTDEQTRINELLKLLKASYDECVKLSEPFRNTLESLTTVTLRVEGAQESHNRDEIKQDQETITTAVDKSVQTSFNYVEPGASTAGKIDNQEYAEISGRRDMDDEQYMATNETATGNTKIPPGFYSNVDTGEITAEVKVEVEFTAELRKNVSDMKRICGRKLEEEMGLSKAIAQKITLDRNIDAEKHKRIIAYITKCAELCWFMMIQEPPVFIGFNDAKTVEPFNKDVYKAYTNTGKQLDYIVLPPLYLHKGGPMLSKGVAQGAN